MREVLLEMFLLESGSFHFTATPVEPDGADTRLDARMSAIRIAAQSDRPIFSARPEIGQLGRDQGFRKILPQAYG
jgi:hypothetical protein